MNTWQEDPVRNLLEELKSDSRRFQRTGGYERLLRLLDGGCSPVAVKELLAEGGTYTGDILWTVCELDDLHPYVGEAVRHIADPDRGTSAYAIEVLLRAANDDAHLKAALHSLQAAPIPVAEHAAVVLASQGLLRAREVFQSGDWQWAALLMDELLSGSRDAETTIKALVAEPDQSRVFVGLVVATIASEQNERAVAALEESEVAWIRDFAGQLRRMFQHRWQPH